jgi:aspartate aminotransferase
LAKVVDLAIKNDLYIISDECYEHFIYGGKRFKSIASFSKEAYERTITINAASKTYAITGWRIGYAAGPENIINTMGNIQSHSTSNPFIITQSAVIEALNADQKFVKDMVKEFDKRRKYTVKHLNEIAGIECPMPEGAFYAFPRVNELYKGEIKNSVDFCNFLLKEASVALVPGDGFEADECIRFSYASSMDSIVEGIERIRKAVEKI